MKAPFDGVSSAGAKLDVRAPLPIYLSLYGCPWGVNLGDFRLAETSPLRL